MAVEPECQIKEYTRILQNLIWRTMTRADRIVVYTLNIAMCLPGFFYFINTTYQDTNESTAALKFFGKQTKFSIIAFVVALIVLPVINFTNQAIVQKFRFALRLSQTGLFCAIINSIFYSMSLNNSVKTTTRKYFKDVNTAFWFYIICIFVAVLMFTVLNPEYDTILNLSKEVKSCKKEYSEIRALRRKAKSDNILKNNVKPVETPDKPSQ